MAPGGRSTACTTPWSSSTSTAPCSRSATGSPSCSAGALPTAPFAEPYPWDVAEGGSRGGFADAVALAAASHDGTGPVETALLHRSGRRVVASVRVSLVEGGRNRPSRLLATVRDVTAEHEARERRATAAALAAELGAADELTDVVAAAVAGLSVLFGGDATVSVVAGRTEQVFTASGPLAPDHLDPRVADRLDADDGRGRRRRRATPPSTASCSRRVAAHPGAGSGSRSRWRAP